MSHGKFRSEERFFDPPLQAAAGKAATIEMPVLCDEPVGAVIENGFLILLVEWLDKHWRIFVRLRVIVNQQGVPETATELITTQRVGFSESETERDPMTENDRDFLILQKMRG